MLQKFAQDLSKLTGGSSSATIAIACSGGKDSVCLAHLFNQVQINFILVHCNFMLRGEDSEGDEAFVVQLGKELSYCKKVFAKKMPCKDQSEVWKMGIQETARKLRYDFFEELYQQKEFEFLATAHHINDNVETFFINLSRKSGLKGLTGIPKKRDYIIRPLLDFSGQDIRQFIAENGIEYREDSSNSKNDYLRNNLRNHLLPLFNAELQDFSKNVNQSISLLNSELELFQFLLDKTAVDIQEFDSLGQISLKLDALRSFPQPHVLLYYIVDKYGFTRTNCAQILDISTQKGAIFKSESHAILHNGHEIIVSEQSISEDKIIVTKPGTYTLNGWKLTIQPTSLFKRDLDKSKETVQLSTITFPFEIRFWERGDFMYPLGMTQRKKLSDLFIDGKINSIEKHKIPLIVKNKEVFWVVGKRISEKIKVQSFSSENLFLFQAKRMVKK